MDKFGKILLKYCNEAIYKLMVGVSESSNVSTEGHILERRSERSNGWVRAAGSMWGLPRLAEDQGNALFGLAAYTIEKRQAGDQLHWRVIFVQGSYRRIVRTLSTR